MEMYSTIAQYAVVTLGTLYGVCMLGGCVAGLYESHVKSRLSLSQEPERKYPQTSLDNKIENLFSKKK